MGRESVALFHRLEADALVVEVNQGGEMAIQVLREVDASVPVTPGARHAAASFARRSPVSVLYAQGQSASRRRLSGAGGRDVRLSRPAASPPAAPPTASTRWSGR
jgi:phage terminase large subunit-like protein